MAQFKLNGSNFSGTVTNVMTTSSGAWPGTPSLTPCLPAAGTTKFSLIPSELKTITKMYFGHLVIWSKVNWSNIIWSTYNGNVRTSAVAVN